MKMKIAMIILVFIAAKSILSVEERITGFPTFAIYSNKIPIYATLSGSFTLHPEKEMIKAENYFKNLKHFDKIGSSGSSYLTIKCEEKILKFHELKNIKSEWNIEESSIIISGQIPNNDIEIFIILKNKKNREGYFFVSYGAVNRSNRIVDIGFRSLLDVGTEANDRFPLKISTDNTNEKEIYSHEYKFTPYKSTYWETYESETDSIVGIRNHMTGHGNTPPDQIAFANWERAFASSWKYFTNKNISTSSDSAVLIWWNPRPVKSGETLLISTEYEFKKKKEEISFELLDSETGSGRLHIKMANNSNYPMEVLYQLDAGDNAFISLNFDNPLKFQVEKNVTLDKVIPITLHGKGDINFTIRKKNAGIETNFNLPVRLTHENRDQSPRFWKSSKYPIFYNSDKDGLKLKGVVRARDTGKKLGETELISVKSMQNSYVYLGEVDIKEFNGEVLVEIFKQ